MHMMLWEFYLAQFGLSPSPWPGYIYIAAQTGQIEVICERKEGKHGKMKKYMEMGGKMELQRENPALCVKM